MALTSPDNLRTPDDGDGYNVVLAMQNLADSVQRALTTLRSSTKTGAVTTNTTTDGYVTVNHGFTVSPKVMVSLGPVDGLPDPNSRLFEPVVFNVNSSNFRVRFKRVDTDAWLTQAQAVTFTWLASIV